MSGVVASEEFSPRYSLLVFQLLLASLGGFGTGWLTGPYDSLFGFSVFAVLVYAALYIFFKMAKRWTFADMTKTKFWFSTLVFVLVQLAAYLSFASMFHTANWAGKVSRFDDNRATYDRTVQLVLDRQWPEGHQSVEIGGQWVALDVRDTVRIGLNWAGAFSNWDYVIYDSSHKIGLVEGYDDRDNYSDHSLRTIFEGRLTACRHLSGAYYSCKFD